jgi:hypothetical protein
MYSYTVLAIFALMLNVMVGILTTRLQWDKLECLFVFNFIDLPKAQKMAKQLHLTGVISDFLLEVVYNCVL